ncbi:MAG: diaminopimelate epimerase [Firmicutes bacterium]|nr:diaminopimelate epimerase [Bacillota bacterium]
MSLKFFKYHGCGNDYVYIDCFKNEVRNPKILSKQISKQHFGVGSDGLILICPSSLADAKIRIFNANGSEATMCGNGIRCTAKYLFDEKIVCKHDFNIETLSGIKNVKILKNSKILSIVKVNMGLPNFEVNCKNNRKKIIDFPFKIGANIYRITYVSIGNPHCVIFSSDIEKVNIEYLSNSIQNSGLFLEDVNFEFVEINSRNSINMRVWERGSGETLACGTGACASVVAAVENNMCDRNVTVNLRGGRLLIEYDHDVVFMTGEAVKVFEGKMEES